MLMIKKMHPTILSLKDRRVSAGVGAGGKVRADLVGRAI
jgi:hypothetical protein